MVAVALCGVLGMALPSPAAASSVAGTVTAEGTAAPIEGIEVCFRPEPEAFAAICALTGPTGQYKAEGLPAANYVVRFSAEAANLKYVSEYYDDAVSYFDLDLFPLGAGQDLQGLDAQLAEGGSIAGTVSDEGTAAPIAGIRACAIDHEGMLTRCATSSASGAYQLNGLPTGTYDVEYEGGNRVNYLREFYEDAATWAAAADLSVTAPAPISGIDAKLAPGAQILGHVSEVGTSAPMADVMVCAEQVAPGEHQACDWTDAAGDYALRSIPAGTYLVAFELEYMPFGRIAGQWWQGAQSAAEATPIAIAPPETRSGIDGQLPPRFPKRAPEPIQVTFVPTSPEWKHPRKCRKGFHKKRVKGRVRCVRKHRRHRHRGGGGALSR